MRFFVKIFLYLAIIGLGALFLFNRSPDLKANILEIINPRKKEARLLGELNKNLGKLESRFSGTSDTPPSNSTDNSTDVRAENRETIKQARVLVDEIEDINEKNSGRLRNVVTRIADTFIPGGRKEPDGQESATSVGNAPEPCVPAEE